jgi:hypothetical protein
MKRWWLYAVAVLVGVLLLGGVLLLFPLGTTPEGACHTAMTRAEGYGPWRYQGRSSRVAGATQAILLYSDGFNTHQCFVRALGPLWFVEPFVSETAVGCSLGVNQGQCPRARYGVAP